MAKQGRARQEIQTEIEEEKGKTWEMPGIHKDEHN